MKNWRQFVKFPSWGSSCYLCIAAHLSIRTGNHGQRTVVVSMSCDLKSIKIEWMLLTYFPFPNMLINIKMNHCKDYLGRPSSDKGTLYHLDWSACSNNFLHADMTKDTNAVITLLEKFQALKGIQTTKLIYLNLVLRPLNIKVQTHKRPLSCGFDSSIGRALHR